MKKILGLALFFYAMVSPAQNLMIEEIRTLYQQAATEEKACKMLIASLEVDVETNPLLFGYRGSATMMMAQHVSNPFNKLSYFHKGKGMLENAINADQENMELRFLRFAAQTNTPAMLGYRGDIEKDKKVIMDGLSNSNDLSLKKLIIGYLMNSEFLDTEEKKSLVAKV